MSEESFKDLLRSVQSGIHTLSLLEKQIPASETKKRKPLAEIQANSNQNVASSPEKQKQQLGRQRDAISNSPVYSPATFISKQAKRLSHLSSKPVVLKTNHRSHYPNLKGSNFEVMACQVISLAGIASRIRFCIFCPLVYRTEISFRVHLLSSHRDSLKLLIDKKYSEFTYQSCPLCPAKFFVPNALVQHLLAFHQEPILEQLVENRYLSIGRCQFCKVAVTFKRLNDWLSHMQMYHLPEFTTVLLIMANYMRIQSSNSMDSSIKTFQASAVVSPRSQTLLYRPLEEVTLRVCEDQDSVLYRKPIPNHLITNENYTTVTVRHVPVKRELRFSVPEAVHHVYTPESSSKENLSNEYRSELALSPIRKLSLDYSMETPEKCTFLCSRKRKPRMRTTKSPTLKTSPIKKHSRLYDLFHTSLSPHSPSLMYRCALCRTRFRRNDELRFHVRAVHPVGKVKPAYSCGVCSAQFYRNRFLVRHCQQQH